MEDGDNSPTGVNLWWRRAAVVLAVLGLTLFAINVVLRGDLDQARADGAAAVEQAERASSDDDAASTRLDEVLSQIEESDTRLSRIVERVRTGGGSLGPATADVGKQVAAQKAAQRALRQAETPDARSAARTAALRWQLRNARTCAAASLRALRAMHKGPDVETGAREAADIMRPVVPACRLGLG
jgi:hypothetical protein